MCFYILTSRYLISILSLLNIQQSELGGFDVKPLESIPTKTFGMSLWSTGIVSTVVIMLPSPAVSALVDLVSAGLHGRPAASSCTWNVHHPDGAADQRSSAGC